MNSKSFNQERYGELPLYSSRIIKCFYEYMGKYHPDIDIGKILDYAGITRYQIEDEGHWLTQTQCDRFYENLLETLGDPCIARHVGQYMPFSNAGGAVKQLCLGFMTTSSAYKMVDILYPHMSRGASLQTRSIGPNQVEVVAIHHPGVREKPYQCENRLGAFEGIAKLFTNKLAAIEHATCIHISGDRCIYRIIWEETPSSHRKRIANYTGLGAILISLILLFALPGSAGVISTLSIMLFVLGINLYRMHLEKDELTLTFNNHRALADDLLEEISTRYNNSMLVQEIGQASSNIIDINKLIEFTLETIKNRLQFERGLIMLANQEGSRLVCASAYGYSPDEEAVLNNAEFHLDNPDSKGPFVVAFKKQRPFLINDVKGIHEDISERSRDFTKQLKVESFICVPIVYEGTSLGILAADNHRLKRSLNQSDVNLFLGIASQIGISINNASSYQKIRESEERFRALSENAPDIIYTTDITGSFTYVNPAWERLLGHAREDVYGKYFTDFIKAGDVQHFTALFKEICSNRVSISNIEGTMLHKDGSERLFTVSGSPNLNTAFDVIGIVGTLRDITKQQMLEMQLLHASKMQAVGTLTGGIAHDFNNILQGLSGYNQLLMMTKDKSHPDWEHLENINRLNQRAADLIKQLLIFSRKVDSRRQPIDLNKEVNEYYHLLKETIPKMISLDLLTDPDLRQIKGDPVQLGQVIMNLAVNARDAMPEGGRLQIETRNIDIVDREVVAGIELNPGCFVRLRVSDTGQGMDRETLAHIFEPFYSTKEAGRGTGLGLAVVHGIVANHGGQICCETEPAKGTTFTIYFPALVLPDRETSVSEVRRDKERLTGGSETLLLVDDEEQLLETSRRFLEQYGYRVLTAKNGEKAIEIYGEREKLISLVLLDLLMPGIGGIRCLEALRKINPQVKVIITSGYITPDKQQEVMNKGATSFIQKPYQYQDILQMIRRTLDGQVY